MADILAGAKAPVSRIEHFIRNIRYGDLPVSSEIVLLSGLYPSLLEENIDPSRQASVLTHYASDVRRSGDMKKASKLLGQIHKDYQTPIWRYEYAFVLMMQGDLKSLNIAEQILEIDCEPPLDRNSLINGGLQALVKIRLGKLQEADSIFMGFALDGGNLDEENTRRWVVNSAIHACETGCGMLAHGLIDDADLKERIRYASGLSNEYWGSNQPTILNFARSMRLLLRGKCKKSLRLIKQHIESDAVRGNPQQRSVFFAIAGVAASNISAGKNASGFFNSMSEGNADHDNRRVLEWWKYHSTGRDADDLIKSIFPLV